MGTKEKEDKMKYIKPKYIFPFSGGGFGTCRPPAKEEVRDAILSHAKKHHQIMHGSFALREQIKPYGRTPHDIDILTNNPRHHMDKMEDKLDLMAGCDAFDEVIMPIIGKEGEYVYKVVKKTFGPDKDVVDYFKMQKGIKTVTIKGVRYEDWKTAKRRLQQIVSNPELRHRHGKAVDDLRRIEAYERSLK